MPMPATKDPALLAKRTSNALDRLDQVEKTLPNLISAINNSLGGLSQQLNSQGKVLEAVMQLLGRETVETTMKEIEDRRVTETMEAEKKALEELLAAGNLAKVEKVTEKSIIVGREYQPDGSLRHPGRAQVAFPRVDPQFQPKLKDQAAGFVMELPNGGKFEVVEVFEVVQKPDEEAAAEAPPPAPEASAPAPEAT